MQLLTLAGEAGKAGQPDALTSLGAALARGNLALGLVPNIPSALSCFCRAACLGEYVASRNLGKYFLGIKNFELAVVALELAALQGDRQAMFMLGTDLNTPQGPRWLSQSALLGHLPAQESVSKGVCVAVDSMSAAESTALRMSLAEQIEVFESGIFK